MLKRVVILLLLAAASVGLSAQGFYKPWSAQKSRGNGDLMFGIKGGIIMPHLYYTEKHLNKLPHDLVINPNASVFVEYKLDRRFSVAAEMNCQLRGGATTYTYQNEYKVRYELKARYISMRFPVFWYIDIHKKFVPYIFISPEFCYSIGGQISLSQPGMPLVEEATIDITDSNMNPYNFGFSGGIGVRKDMHLKNWTVVIKADFSTSWWVLNTFSASEMNETAVAINVNAYNSQGKRYSTGMELNLSLGLLRDKDMGVCDPF